MTKNLTVGNPALLILFFTLPLLIGNLFQQFYNMADTFIIGRTIGAKALAAVGCTGSINFLVLGFLWNFCQGVSIVTSQRFGAGDSPGVRRSFAAAIILGLAVTLILVVFSVLSARPLLRFLKTPPEIMEDAYSYIIIIFQGLPAVLVFNLFSNGMRAVGDSFTPLIFLSVACIINIILDYVFILVFHTGVEGAAYATIIAQLVSGLLCLLVVMTKLPILRIRREDWRITGRELWEHLRIGLPMGFQMSVIAIGAVAVTYALNRLGAVAVAAFTTSQKIDMLATMPLQSFGAAMTTYAAQNYGARKIDRIRAGLVSCVFMSASFAVFIGIVFFFFGGHLSALFLGKEGEAVSLSHTYLRINGSFYILLSFLFIFRQSLQGLGQSMVTTFAGMMELFMRTFAAIFLSRHFGFAGISFSSPLAWAGAMIPLGAATFLTFRKLGRKALAEKKSRPASR